MNVQNSFMIEERQFSKKTLQFRKSKPSIQHISCGNLPNPIWPQCEVEAIRIWRLMISTFHGRKFEISMSSKAWCAGNMTMSKCPDQGYQRWYMVEKYLKECVFVSTSVHSENYIFAWTDYVSPAIEPFSYKLRKIFRDIINRRKQPYYFLAGSPKCLSVIFGSY